MDIDIDISEAFDGPCAFSKDGSIQVEFSTQSDAMIASLQLFHDVPWSTIDLVISLLTHPEFNSKEITLCSSVDAIRAVETVRLRNRLAEMQERSIGSKGHAGPPRFVLEEVLDIIEAKKVERIIARLEEDPLQELEDVDYFHLKEDAILSNMSLVHRSWTLPSQKALGRSFYIGKPITRTSFLYRQIDKSIHGPWTTLIALDLYYLPQNYNSDFAFKERLYANFTGHVSEYDYYEQRDIYERKKHRQWFQALHYFLLGFENLKCLLLRSHSEILKEWSEVMVRQLIPQNLRLEVLTFLALEGYFDLDPLLRNESISKNLRSLSIQGGIISEESRTHLWQEGSFANLCNLTIEFNSLEELAILPILATQSIIHLESLALTPFISLSGDEDSAAELEGTLPAAHCALLFARLHTLCIKGGHVLSWLEWIRPYCSILQNLSITVSLNNYADVLRMVPLTIQSLSLVIIGVLTAKEWEPQILEVFTSNRCPKMKWFNLKINQPLIKMSITDNWFYDPGEGERSIQAFDKRVKSICCNAGITFQLDFSVNHDYTQFGWLDTEF